MNNTTIRTSDREFWALFVLTANAVRHTRLLITVPLPTCGLIRVEVPEQT